MQFYDNMPTKRQREIVIEYERILLIRRRAKTDREHCKFCRADVDLVSITAAAEIFETPEVELFRFMQINRCHFTAEKGETVRICIPSLLACLKTRALNRHIKRIGESK